MNSTRILLNISAVSTNLFIGEQMAEKIKIAIGSAYPLQEEKTASVRGRNLITGLPEELEISSIEIREALSGSVQVIIDTIERCPRRKAPPEILSDLMDNGICLAGVSLNCTAWLSG